MAIYGGPDIITDGLVLHLDAANSKSYSGSGNIWYDLSESNNNGILTNNPTFNNNTNGGAFILDGINDFIDINNTTNTDLVSNFTVECLFRQNSNLNPGPLVEKYNWFQPNKGGWGLRFGGGNLNFFGVDYTTSSSVSVTSPLSINITYHVVSICDGGPTNPTVKLYINGLFNNSNILTNQIKTTVGKSVMIGQRGDGSGLYNNVNIFSIKIYNRVISPSEILQNYNALKGRFGL